jgi:hypothetical protein
MIISHFVFLSQDVWELLAQKKYNLLRNVAEMVANTLPGVAPRSGGSSPLGSFKRGGSQTGGASEGSDGAPKKKGGASNKTDVASKKSGGVSKNSGGASNKNGRAANTSRVSKTGTKPTLKSEGPTIGRAQEKTVVG